MPIDPVSTLVITKLLSMAVEKYGSYLSQRWGARLSKAEYQRECTRVAEAYAKFFADRYNPVFAPAHITRPAFLTQVYVKPDVRSTRQSLRSLSIREVEEELFRGDDPRTVDPQFDGLLLVETEPHLLVLGRAGAGKSAFLRRIGLAYLRNETRVSRIPFLIDARHFISRKMEIDFYLAELLDFGVSWQNTDAFVRDEILLRSRGILLWDGLDEVHSRDDLNIIINSIATLSSRYPECPQIVACRSASYHEYLPFFREIEIAPFGPAQIRQFVYNWFSEDTLRGQLVLQRIEGSGPAQQLFNSPLLLTLQCLAADEDLHGFQSRAHLFKSAVTVLLSKWDASRNIVRDQPYRELDANNKAVLLSKIAANGVEEGIFTWPETDLATRIVFELSLFLMPGQQVDGRAVLESIEAQHGILEKRAREVWSFSHMAFQEYFAALALADKNDWDQLLNLIKTKIDDPAWREILILIMCLKNDASPLVELVIDGVRRGLKDRNLAAHIRAIEGDDSRGNPLTPNVTRSLCLLLVLHQVLHLASLVDEWASTAVGAIRTDLSSALRSVVQRLYSEGDIDLHPIGGVYVSETSARRKPFSIEFAASRDRIYERLQEAIEAARQVGGPYDRGSIGQEIVSYFNLSNRENPDQDSLLGRWDHFRLFGRDVAWVFRRLLFCCEIVQAGVIMAPNLRQACVEGLVNECIAALTAKLPE